MSGRSGRSRRGLQLRIAATVAGIVLLAVAALGLAVHQMVVLDRVRQSRDTADAQIAAAVDVYRRTRLLSFDASLDDTRLPAELRRAVRSSGDRGTLVTGGRTRVVWAAARVGDEVISTRTSVDVVDGSVRALDRALLLAGGTTVVVAILLGLLSAARIARPLRGAARTARRVAAGEPAGSLREAVGGRSDEIGELADAVDAMAARLDARLRAEQQFTADVAHDLRTPVTGLTTAADLLDDSRPAVLVRDRAAALAALVEDLLEVARLDRGSETADLESVDLAEAVRRAVRRGVATGELVEQAVRVGADPDPVRVVTDPRRLERVLSNLVRNAVAHGAPPVEVVQRGSSVLVRDHGAGFDETMLADGPRRFRRSRRTPGNGLGLVIAAGQADVIGADLRFANAEGGGALVTLVLPGEPGSRSPHGEVTIS
ncbi:sensor protein CseC [Marmoricola endophyticus]|uniref:histidine kinase n=1 Tax=Marmoricola endophyticus TaxID=2040280 RepID=A0A917BFV6_9ACTN|nr:HAMP domain-containing sensor histidine kinase [Marmoricola endophyticus]GGF42268.1 sensor protein CseC [Marmoricola endophyticus]